MSAANPFAIQQQVRENSEELQNYLMDLENWEKDMKKKEEELKLLKINDEESLPPIRNLSSRSKKKNKPKKLKSNEKSKEEERISSFDYKAWEKFDVDSELKKLDEEKELTATESSDSEEELNIQQRKQHAILKKDKGNEFFKKGNYDAAINCYTVGMELDPENPLLPANRAMALIKKEQFQAAENDCSLCLSLDATYIKAYLRRATARRALKKFLLAEEDYLKILELEPNHKSVLITLENMRKEMEMTTKTKETTCLNKKRNLDLENSLIKENGESPSNRLENLLNVMEQEKTLMSPSSLVDETFTKHSSPLKIPVSEAKSEPSKTSSKWVDFSEIEEVVKKLEQTLPPVPTAAYQFLTDWRKLTKYPDLRYQYLKQFPPEKLPVVFKHYMDAEIFCGILQTLSSSFISKGDDVSQFMKYLTQVGRFQTLILVLSNQEQKDLKKLYDYLKETKSLSDVEGFLKLYKL